MGGGERSLTKSECKNFLQKIIKQNAGKSNQNPRESGECGFCVGKRDNHSLSAWDSPYTGMPFFFSSSAVTPSKATVVRVKVPS